jgi:hypothetical protein
MTISAPVNSFVQRMPAGIPGDISRKEGAIVEPRAVDATNPPTAYGTLVAVDATSRNIRKILAGDTIAQAYGMLVRPFPISNFNTTDGLGQSAVNTNFPLDVMKRGYMNVLLGGTAAAQAGGTIYIRVGNPNGTTKLIGGIEAANDIGVTATGPVGTGNGTIGTLSAADSTLAGVYTAKALTATNFNLLDAAGAILGNFNTGVTYTADNGLTLRITVGGTAFVAGDAFTITVVQNTFPLAVPATSTYFTGPADANGNVEIAFRA